MPTYSVDVHGTWEKRVTVEAASQDEAERIGWEQAEAGVRESCAESWGTRAEAWLVDP